MKLLILTTAMLLTSCAATTPEIKYELKTIDTSCNWVKVISISGADNITDITARQILAHNRQVRAKCP